MTLQGPLLDVCGVQQLHLENLVIFPTCAECNPRQHFNASTHRCECLPGWAGPQCDACQTDAACADMYAVPEASATCSRSYDFVQESQYKAYTCTMEVWKLPEALCLCAARSSR